MTVGFFILVSSIAKAQLPDVVVEEVTLHNAKLMQQITLRVIVLLKGRESAFDHFNSRVQLSRKCKSDLFVEKHHKCFIEPECPSIHSCIVLRALLSKNQ